MSTTAPLFPWPDDARPTQVDTRDRYSDRERVRRLLLEHPEGLTDWDIADLLGEPLRKGTFCRRRAECGAVPVRDADGEPVTRVSHGSRCMVWRLEPGGGAA